MTRLEDLTEQEITRRVPVWTALAELYLDNEMQEYAIRYMADRIHEAGYRITEAESFLRYEVGPVFVWNLVSVAGEWALFEQDDVREEVLARLDKFRLWERIPFWRDLLYAYQYWFVEDTWLSVKAQLEELYPRVGDDVN